MTRDQKMVATANGQHTGKIVQVIGSTFDAEFEEGKLPEIYNALTVESDAKGVKIKLVGEVQQQLGGNRVRCVALGSTDGLHAGHGRGRHRRGGESAGRRAGPRAGIQPARRSRSTAAGRCNATEFRPIHQEPPRFDELTPKTELFETGIKVDRPAHPAGPRRQGRAVRRGRPRQDRHPPGTHRPDRQPARRLFGVRRRR